MEGFHKASFSDKILFAESGMEILSETRRAWTCFIVNLELIFGFFFYFFSSIVVMESSIKHPQAPQGMELNVAQAEFSVMDEERSGGVAAIEQPR